jgi:hypothetical protein
MRSYPRRTTDLYASDTDRWSRPLNRVRAPPVSICGVQKTCTPRLCLHPGRIGVPYATDADSRVPPLYVISLFHCIMGLTYFLFFSFLSFFPFISCFHWESLHFMRIARYFIWVVMWVSNRMASFYVTSFVGTRPYRTRAWPSGWRGSPQRLIFVSTDEKCFFHFRSAEIGFFCDMATET